MLGYSAVPRTMSHLNRAAPGSGGLPPTSGSSLSPGGLGGLAPGVSTAILSSNTILSNLAKATHYSVSAKIYERWARRFVMLYLTSEIEDARRVYDGLDSDAKPKASLYTPSTSVRTPSAGCGLIKLSRLSHLIVDDAHLVALEDLSSPLSTILLDHYGKLPTAGRPRVLGLTHYPLELEANFGYSALRMEQLLDARILGNLDAKRLEVAHNANRLEVSVLEYESVKEHCPYSLQVSIRLLKQRGWCVPLFSLFNPDSDSEGLIMDKRTVTIPLLEGISLDQTSKLNEILKYLNAASMSSHFRCIIIVRNPFTALALEWHLSIYQQPKVRSALYLDHLKIDHESGTREALEEDFKNGQCAPLSLITEQVELAFRYTLNLWRILGNKQYDSPSGELAYFVLPVKFGPNFEPTRIARTTSIEPCISWQEVNDLVSFRVRPLKCNNVDEMWLDLMNGVIQDRSNEFTRRFENAKLRKDLNPLSLIMQDKPGEPQISLLDYYRTHRHEFEGIKTYSSLLLKRLCYRPCKPAQPPGAHVQRTTNYLVPEICYVSSIPAPTFRTASLLPSVIWHIENVLIAKEVNLTFFQGQIQDELVAHALCSRMAHRTFSYERLEFLGDTFIKYAASAYLYGVEPTAPSGVLHSKRQKMVNNRSLWLGAQALGLPPCIQSDVFRPKQWVIPNVLISKKSPIHGENPGFTGQAQLLNSRHIHTIADVVEAMIGAALLSEGEELAFSVAKTLGFDTLKTCDWLDVISYAPNKSMTMKESDHKGETLDGLIKIIGVSLDNPELLLQAMNCAATRINGEIFRIIRTPRVLGGRRSRYAGCAIVLLDEEEWSPHSMTLIKSSMVSNRALAIICIESGLHQYLMHDTNSLAQSIVTFIDEVQKCKQIARTDAQRLKYWSKLVAPKALGDVVESLLGAIYISSGFSITRVKTVYDRVLKPFYDRYIDKKAMLTHPMSRLMKRLESIGCRSFGVAKAETQLPNGGTGFKCEVKIHGQIIVQASSEKAQQAIKDATERALNLLDAQPDRVLANSQKSVNGGCGEGEIVEALPGDDADHPIDVDMFDF
ncbi:endoribonuclease Dicer [Rhizoctonia solani]|uniref:Endoribonuclease Dicer n=1 Tax=Rhizoctonia solani TaxID=456999 RepID=A0A8H8SUN3_9AGAM|nr:endoribonuclease Dicer [Rhizoctonia solani]QRW19106.1 endoribonuclease Dicer [Rhizoctonia solani]